MISPGPLSPWKFRDELDDKFTTGFVLIHVKTD